ncbi:MAG: NAD(P)-dependent oxidoreductase [Pyrinomonadaceae bacterium]|nr:NAD(P)-dependent oxidoreductase [Pyrinomonadaceae bacterium]
MSNSTKKVILTGADGFIGRHAIDPLRSRGFEVHAVSNIEPPDELRIEGVRWHKVDLLDNFQASNLCYEVGAGFLLHFSWYVEHGKFWDSPKNLEWVKASTELVEQFVESGGKRAVLAGTCAEYDLSTGRILNENSVCEPESLYGRSKLELFEWLEERKISSAWGRVFFLYGPHEAPNRLVASVIRSLLSGETARCSHGNQLRDFMHVKDVASAFSALLDSDVEGAVNIASGKAVTIKDVVNVIGVETGRPTDIDFGAFDAPENEPELVVADVAKLRDEVEWKPMFDLEKGIRDAVDFWRNRRPHTEGQ